MFRLIVIGAIGYFILQSGIIEQLLVDIKPLDEVTCDDVEAMVEKMTLKNGFGMPIEVIKISNTYEHSRNDRAVRCIGVAVLSTGRKTKLIMRAYDDEEGDRMYEVKTQ